jgi:hypothetical protein
LSSFLTRGSTAGSRANRRIAQVALAIIFCVGVVATRVVVSGRAELGAGRDALAHGDAEEAVVRLRRAARWYAPGARHPAAALDLLEQIAARAEAAGDARTARLAWEAERSAILAARSFYVPFAERLPVANRHIAELLAREEGPAADPEKSEAQRAAWHLALLTRDDAPLVGFTILALVGFVGWIAGALVLIYRGVDASDRLRPRAALRAGALIVAGYAAFLIGLARA